MIESERAVNGIGVIAGDIWLTGMRQAGLSEQEISRVVSTTTALAESGNGQGNLVPVKEAARRIGRSENTVRSWIRLGHLPTVEVPPPPDHAKGPWVHVDMADVESLDNSPDAEEEFITLREASERFGLKRSRLKRWTYRGILAVHGDRKVGRAMYVSVDDVAALAADPPRPGRRRPLDKQ